MTNSSVQRDILQKHSWLRIDPSDIQIDSKPHAKGGQADVITAILKRTIFGRGIQTRVAVKKLRYYGDTDNDKFSKSFVYEVDILAGLSHRNIVKLLGFLENLETGYACMVFTWEENGNVQEFLAKRACDIPERLSLVRLALLQTHAEHTLIEPILD
ncbi:hypothetical protein FRC00_007353 [Tulasnella sp. 408]|nr:hypothetical protein FRC00_007353 [Tulasnella sp. 408]